MKTFTFIIIGICLSIAHGQLCRGKYAASITGQCAYPFECEGTMLSGGSCEFGGCCVNRTTNPPVSNCLNQTLFKKVYNSSRGAYLAKILNYGINQAGICGNCQAKAAFLAIASTMTEDFEKDEATGTTAFFAADDRRYGNSQVGDGSRFRRRGFFGLRGRAMYERLQRVIPRYQVVNNSESAAIAETSILIAADLWKNPTLLGGPALTQYADGTFYKFSFLWFTLTGGIEQLPVAAKQYSKFLRLLECGGDLYPGQGSGCRYNATHNGTCVPDCIRGLEDAGEICGCSGDLGPVCPSGPPHIRCCLDSCSQELKMDLGLVLDASGSIAVPDYARQITFTKDLLHQVNVGKNKTHVGIINFSDTFEILSWLNTDYDLREKLRRVDAATHIKRGTNTALALREANLIFSYRNGLRQPEEGAVQVIFVITDGASDDETATLRAADVLKSNGIHLVSVGVGDNLRLHELHAMCTQPASENYFPMANYAALDQKLNQFTSKFCTAPAVVPGNTTVTGEVGKGKYKFLKFKIIISGNKIMIKIKLFNGKVKLFYSFTIRNPKDPNDFTIYQPETATSSRSLLAGWKDMMQRKSSTIKADDGLETIVIDKPEGEADFVYVGVKGVEEENKFEANLEDCKLVNCRSAASSLTMKFHMILMVLSILFSMKIFQ